MSEPDQNRDDTGRRDRKPYTAFANAFMCLAMSALLFSTPWYFGLQDVFGYIAGLILSIVCYFAAVVFLVMVMSFLSAALKTHPELRRLVPGAGTNEDAWQGAFGTATFLAIASSIHYVAIGIFGADGIVAVVAKAAVIVFILFAATQAATAIDGFFIRPLLASASEGEEARNNAITRVRKIGTIIFTAIALIAGIATIIDVAFLQ